MFATGSKKVIFSREVSENFVTNSAAEFFFTACSSCCVSFVLSAWRTQPTRPRFLRASWVQTSPTCTTMELLLNRPLERVGKFNEGGHKVICDVLCSLELLRHPPQESQLIILSTPYGWILMSRGSTQLYSMFLSTDDVEGFLVNLSVKQALRHLLTTYPVLPSEWWDWRWHTVGCVSVWAHSCHLPSRETGETVASCYTSDRHGKAEEGRTSEQMVEPYLSTTDSFSVITP